MDNSKIGRLICKLRKENGYTQLQLAQLLSLSDKTVSKWERGNGCPDISVLKSLSEIFQVDMEKLLEGEIEENRKITGNMRKTSFYICPVCGNIITGLTVIDISCCGKKLSPAPLQKAGEDDRLNVEIIDNHYVVTAAHPMMREHYIAFVALLTVDGITIRKQYPEWDMLTRFQYPVRGRLVWYCTQHGLFYQEIRK